MTLSLFIVLPFCGSQKNTVEVQSVETVEVAAEPRGSEDQVGEEVVAIADIIQVGSTETKNETTGSSKRALVVAIAKYDKANTGWSPINAHNDVPLMKAALIHQGFPEDQIMISEDGTKQQILDAFESFTKSIPEQSGDAIVIHFSSHGQQIKDQNGGDEIDGKDEAIIPVDAAVSPKYNNYDGSNHLRDDQIGELLTAIRQRVGPEGNVFLIMDACHSGTSSRGMGTARGSHLVFGGAAEVDASQAAEESGGFGVVSGSEDLASLVAFYGTSADNLNFETTDDAGKAVGSLTYGVSKALVDADENTSYEALFGMVRNYMARKSVRNVPQKEGNTDQVILGGALLPPTSHFTVMQYKADRKLAVINGGELHGIFSGSKVAFYEPDTRDLDSAEPIVTGKVLASSEISARIALDDMIPEDILNPSWVHITEYALNYPDLTALAFDVQDNTLRDRIVELFGDQSVVSFVSPDEPHDLILEDVRSEAGMLQIYTKDDNVILRGSSSKLDAYDVHEVLLDYIHSQHLRNLEVEDPRLGATLELIPVTIEEDLMGGYEIKERLPLSSKQDASENLVFNPTDVYRLKITNNSTNTIYFNVVDITPTGRKQCLVPDIPEPGYEPAVTEAECQLGPGQSIELPNENVSPGYMIENDPGKETLKLIVTSEPWNICETIQSRGAGTRSAGQMNPLDILLDNTFQLEGTRSRPLTAPRGGAAISSFSYVIE